MALPAPALIPIIPGSANGLPVHDWAMAPAIASDAPTISANNVRGMRKFHTTSYTSVRWADSGGAEASESLPGPWLNTARMSPTGTERAPTTTERNAAPITSANVPTVKALCDVRIDMRIRAIRRTSESPTEWLPDLACSSRCPHFHGGSAHGRS